jgi:hypothetical protein
MFVEFHHAASFSWRIYDGASLCDVIDFEAGPLFLSLKGFQHGGWNHPESVLETSVGEEESSAFSTVPSVATYNLMTPASSPG